MGGLRRWRILFIVFVSWVLFCWYWFGAPIPSQVAFKNPLSFAPPAAVPGGTPSTPAPPPKEALTGDIRYKKHPDRYPVDSPLSIPAAAKQVKKIKVQADEPKEDDEARTTRLARLGKIKQSFKHSWDGYAKKAWLHDEVAPVSGESRDPFGGWAATLVDSLDSLFLLGFDDEFARAVEACEKIDFGTSSSQQINVFETTIRYLGGFLGAYELSGAKHDILLKKAVEVGDLLMAAFDTPNRMPITRWDWKEYVRGAQQVAQTSVLVAEIGSLTLEFTKLSELTKDSRYYDAVKRISDELELSQDRTRLPGLWPVVVDASAPNFHAENTFTIGGMADSLYEYFPKLYHLLSGRLEQPKQMYDKFRAAADAHIFWRALNPDNRDIVLAGDASLEDLDGVPTPKYKYRGQHLTCFAGGMVGLASRVLDRPEDMDLAVRLTNGCVWAYNATQNLIMPEIFGFVPCGLANATSSDCKWSEARWRKALGERWGTSVAHADEQSSPAAKKGDKPKRAVPKPPPSDESSGKEGDVDVSNQLTLDKQIDLAIAGERLVPGFVEVQDRRYGLRPEAIESVFLMWRLTGDRSWQEIAWTLFERIDKISRTELAASAVLDVTAPRGEARLADSMESFWLAETLKYFALVFSEWRTVDLDEWVLNTEAHPFKRIVQ